ncbi:hypothetical protein EDB80DRAFT_826903 [Ilyonectria destructans]|nr:hypothetical protein EDB80DRAFT_826903 [Ilyonectria destructans]
MARSHHEPDSMDSSSIELPGPADQGHDNSRPRPPRRSLVDQDIQKAEALKWLEDADYYSAFGWAMRYARLVTEYPTPDVLNGMKIWDVDVAYNIQAFVARYASTSKRARDLQLLPRASLSHLVYLPAWREQIAQAFDFDDVDDDTNKAMITRMEPIEPNPPRAVRLQDPLPSPRHETSGSLLETSRQHQPHRDPRRRTDEDDNLSSSDDSIGLAKCRSRDTTPFSTETDGSMVKRIKRETVGTFDPDFKDYKKTGLVIVQALYLPARRRSPGVVYGGAECSVSREAAASIYLDLLRQAHPTLQAVRRRAHRRAPDGQVHPRAGPD